MLVLIFIVFFGLLAFFANGFVRKYSLYFYIFLIVLGGLSIALPKVAIFKISNQGFLGLALFYLVMVAGSFGDKTKIRRKLTAVRKEFSIMGFIAITPHAVTKLIAGINGTLDVGWFGIAVYTLMIPLFITSFIAIRKKMSPKSWKQLQSIAYGIYLLLLVHLIINYTETIGLIIYLALFSFYIVNKSVYEIRKYLAKKKKQKPKLN